MAVDHGLGGKNNSNSRAKREKRGKAVEKKLKKLKLRPGKKFEVKFDETARTEWLSGFHKRKQERRQYGIAMEVRFSCYSHRLRNN